MSWVHSCEREERTLLRLSCLAYSYQSYSSVSPLPFHHAAHRAWYCAHRAAAAPSSAAGGSSSSRPTNSETCTPNPRRVASLHSRPPLHLCAFETNAASASGLPRTARRTPA